MIMIDDKPVRWFCSLAFLLMTGTNAYAAENSQASQPAILQLEQASIHQEVSFDCSAASIYSMLTNSDEFSAFSGYPAQISAQGGGSFSLFSAQITGMTVELEQNRSIVQAWRVASWPAATYSIVRFSLQSAGDTTTLTLDQTGFPSGTGEHLDQGWHSMYWEPLKIYCMQ